MNKEHYLITLNNYEKIVKYSTNIARNSLLRIFNYFNIDLKSHNYLFNISINIDYDEIYTNNDSGVFIVIDNIPYIYIGKNYLDDLINNYDLNVVYLDIANTIVHELLHYNRDNNFFNNNDNILNKKIGIEEEIVETLSFLIILFRNNKFNLEYMKDKINNYHLSEDIIITLEMLIKLGDKYINYFLNTNYFDNDYYLQDIYKDKYNDLINYFYELYYSFNYKNDISKEAIKELKLII